MNTVDQRFATTYVSARERFLKACASRDVTARALEHPTEKGPEGEALYTDIAWVGTPEAPNLIIVSSGTHGVEGLCGSGIQSWMLQSRQDSLFADDCAIVLIHASNPYGFANLRRVTEGNVDLNRNFIDHLAAPRNPAYDEIHRLLVPTDWYGSGRLEADLAIARFRAERGDDAWQAAVTGGQYEHADGLFYGGTQPVWANRLWRQFVAESCGNRRHIVHIDLHTGLGPYGQGEKLVVARPMSPEYHRAKELLGEDIRSPWSGESVSAPVVGFLGEVFGALPASTLTTLMALEFGTVPLEQMIATLRADNWVRIHADPRSDDVRSMRHLMKAAFFVDELDWQDRVIARTAETLERISRRLPHV